MESAIDVLSVVAIAYGTLALVKLLLILPTHHIAAKEVSRRLQVPFTVAYIQVLIISALTVFVTLPVLLWTERFSFFRLYTRQEVVDQFEAVNKANS